MNFITSDDVFDEIVSCSDEDITEANGFLTSVARKLGLSENDILETPVYTVKRLACVYALYVCCVRNIGKDNLTSLDSESVRQDIYAQKAQYYKAELDRLNSMITSDDFTGKPASFGSCLSVPVRRA